MDWTTLAAKKLPVLSVLNFNQHQNTESVTDLQCNSCRQRGNHPRLSHTVHATGGPPNSPSWKRLLFRHDSLRMQRRSLLFLLSDPCVCFKGRRLSLFISCSSWRRVFKADRFERMSPRSRGKRSRNRQVTVLTVGKNILGTSSSLSPLGRVNPSIACAIRFTFCCKVRIKRGLLDDGVFLFVRCSSRVSWKRWSTAVQQIAAKSRLELQNVEVPEMNTSSSLSRRSVTYGSECLNFFDGLAGQYLAVAKWPRGMIHPSTCKGTCLLEWIIQSRWVQLRKTGFVMSSAMRLLLLDVNCRLISRSH